MTAVRHPHPIFFLDGLSSISGEVPENVDEPMAHSAYGALVNKSAVCEGYAKAYKLLLDEMGIENDSVFNDVHAWNNPQI
mgnify:FL=1